MRMKPDVLEVSKKHGPVYAAIVEVWGERCPDYDPDCLCCRAWADYDRGAAVQWRPIETAPKDGTPILLLIQFPDEPPHIITALWDGRVPKWPWRPVGGSSAYGEEYTTHFLPLPPPPKGAEE